MRLSVALKGCDFCWHSLFRLDIVSYLLIDVLSFTFALRLRGYSSNYENMTGEKTMALPLAFSPATHRLAVLLSFETESSDFAMHRNGLFTKFSDNLVRRDSIYLFNFLL